MKQFFFFRIGLCGDINKWKDMLNVHMVGGQFCLWHHRHEILYPGIDPLFDVSRSYSFRAKLDFCCSEKEQTWDSRISFKCPSSPSVKECLRTSSQAPIQIEISVVRTEKLFHPIDNALTPRILNFARFSFSSVNSPTIWVVLCFKQRRFVLARTWCAASKKV